MSNVQAPAIKAWVEIAAALAVIAGVPLFFVQQLTQMRATQVESALQFAAIHESEDLAALRAKVEAPWARPEMVDYARAPRGSANDIKFKNDVVEGAGITPTDLTRLADFYRTVVSCRERGVCDRETTDLYFREAVIGFYCHYDAPLQAIAKRYGKPDYLTSIDQYAGSCKAGYR